MKVIYPHNRMFNDVVFEGRNKSYGAYFLRHMYSRNMVLAIFFSIGIFFLVVNVPEVIRLLKGYLPEVSVDTDVTQVFLTPPPTEVFVRAPEAHKPQRKNPGPKGENSATPTIVAENLDDIVAEPTTNIDSQSIETGSENREGNNGEIVGGGQEEVSRSFIEGNQEITPETFLFVEQMPEFKDGYPGLIQYLQKNLKYPVVARENGISGKVIIQFIVTPEGKIKDAKVVRGIGGGCDQEAMRVVMSMPDWKPGRHNGHAVPVRFTLPISFQLK